jgi:hypothetical protein
MNKMNKMMSNLPSFNVLIIFLLITGNYLSELIPCNIQKILSSKIGMLLKHIIAYFTLVFFVSLDQIEIKDSIEQIFKKSFIIYLLFILLTKNNKYTFLIVIILLLITYIMYIVYKNYSNRRDLSKKQKKFLLNYKKINTIFNYIIFIILIIGFISYMGEKKYEYKSKFSYIDFILGLQKCSFSKSNISFINSIKYLFKY